MLYNDIVFNEMKYRDLVYTVDRPVHGVESRFSYFPLLYTTIGLSLELGAMVYPEKGGEGKKKPSL